MSRHNYPSDSYRPPDNINPRPTYPQSDWPTFQNSSYAPGQSAYTATRNSYIPNPNHYTQRQSHNPYKHSQGQSSYRANNHTLSDAYQRNRRDSSRNARNYVLDDQIAPSASSYSISALHRWAQATSSILTVPPRWNEGAIVKRIEGRYGTGTGDGIGGPRYSGGFEEKGRKRIGGEMDGISKGERQGKRNRGEEDVIDLTQDGDEEEEEVEGEEYDDAESSEWS